MILVMGSGGMLGRALLRAGEERMVEIEGLTHGECDIADPDSVKYAAQTYSGATCINAAGIVRGHDDLGTVETLYQVNGYAPHILARFFHRVAQISTDCVFDGIDGHYNEESIPNPLDAYGKAKVCGELLHRPHLTIRGSFVGFGTRGFLRRMILDQEDGASIEGYVDHLWNGLSVDVFASLALFFARTKNIYGVVHIGMSQPITKFDLLRRVAAMVRPDIRVMPVETHEPRLMILESVIHLQSDYPGIMYPLTWDTMLERMCHEYTGSNTDHGDDTSGAKPVE